ncbi:MAG TPA: hypothetical protein VNB22_20600 [Pyrinomonadaceae bacterium]|nr:hypothetical protein [Pyrinomonadaceae bacterium]
MFFELRPSFFTPWYLIKKLADNRDIGRFILFQVKFILALLILKILKRKAASEYVKTLIFVFILLKKIGMINLERVGKLKTCII